MERLGLERTVLKTHDFRVRPAYKTINKNSVFEGYVANHSLEISLPIGKEFLNKVLAGIVNSKVDAQIYISFTVKNVDAARDEVLAKAVAASRHNADILARSANVRLGQLVEIRYSWSDIHIHSGMNAFYDSSMNYKQSAPDIEPDNIQISESVTLEYEIVD